MPTFTRRIRTLSFEVFFVRLPVFQSRRTFSSETKTFWRVFSRQSLSALFGAREDDCAFSSAITSVAAGI